MEVHLEFTASERYYTIDLQELGFEEGIGWEDLSDDDKQDVIDMARSEIYVECEVKGFDEHGNIRGRKKSAFELNMNERGDYPNRSGI